MNREFWNPIPIAEPVVLKQLAQFVISHSEKRSPIWKFRLAPDLGVRIQAKVTQAFAMRLECKAVLCEGLDLTALKSPRSIRDRAWWMMGFDIRLDREGRWYIKPGSIVCARRADTGVFGDLRDRVVAAIPQLERPVMMSPHCLCCGKGFTDPVSMARRIGPECARDNSQDLRFLLDRAAQSPAMEVSHE